MKNDEFKAKLCLDYLVKYSKKYKGKIPESLKTKEDKDNYANFVAFKE
jgi:hypothetical protein